MSLAFRWNQDKPTITITTNITPTENKRDNRPFSGQLPQIKTKMYNNQGYRPEIPQMRIKGALKCVDKSYPVWQPELSLAYQNDILNDPRYSEVSTNTFYNQYKTF